MFFLLPFISLKELIYTVLNLLEVFESKKSFNNWKKKCHEFFCVKKISFENRIFVAPQRQLLVI